MASQAQLTSKWAALRRPSSLTQGSKTVHRSAGSRLQSGDMGLCSGIGATLPIPDPPYLSPRPQDSAALCRPQPLPGRHPPAPELTQATSSRFLRAPRGAREAPHEGRSGVIPRCPRPGGAPAAFAAPRSAELRLGRSAVASGRPMDRDGSSIPGAGNRSASAPRTGASGLPAPGLVPYLQQLYIARWEPAAESVLLLAFPPAAVRDLQQRDQLARGEAQPLPVPLPGEGVQGPAAGAGHGLGARAHSAACISAEPRGLGSGSAGSQAPSSAPGSRALGARRLGGCAGIPGQAGGVRSAQRIGDSLASESKRRRPRVGQLADPSSGQAGGAGLRGRRPRSRGLERQLPADAERGLPPRGPARAGDALARGNAQLPGEVGSGASPSAGLRGEGVARRTWSGVGGRVAELGLPPRRGRRGGGWTRAATPAEGWAFARPGGRSLGRGLPITPHH